MTIPAPPGYAWDSLAGVKLVPSKVPSEAALPAVRSRRRAPTISEESDVPFRHDPRREPE